MKEQLQEQGVEEDTANKMLAVMACRSVEELEQVLGECEALEDLQELFALAEGYGFHDWLECNASVVRGLAYYTGVMVLLIVNGQATASAQMFLPCNKPLLDCTKMHHACANL